MGRARLGLFLVGMAVVAGVWGSDGSAMAADSSRSAALTLRCGNTSCVQTMLEMLNAQRASHLLPNLILARKQSEGAADCAGSYGHSVAMAASHTIWHVNARFPHASYPNNVCVRYTATGENVGVATTGDTLGDLQMLEQMMMSEPHGKATCAATYNHACNILDPAFHHVGIGIYEAYGATWLTEDFLN